MTLEITKPPSYIKKLTAEEAWAQGFDEGYTIKTIEYEEKEQEETLTPALKFIDVEKKIAERGS